MESSNSESINADSGVSTEHYIDRLRTRLEITRGCKYKAAHRLKRKHNYSNTALGFISAYLVIVSIFSALSNNSISEQKNMTIITISLSIIILVYGQIIFFKSYNKSAYALKKQAAEIDIIHDKLLFEIKKLSTDPIKLHNRANELSKKYSSILKSEGETHEQMDYCIFLMEQSLTPFTLKKKEYSSWAKYKTKFIYKHLNFLHYYLLIHLSPVALILWYFFENMSI